MTFFKHTDPEIDWQKSRVRVTHAGEEHELPVVAFKQNRMSVTVKTWPSVTVNNAFAGLECEPCVDNDNECVVATEQLFPRTSTSDMVAAPVSNSADVYDRTVEVQSDRQGDSQQVGSQEAHGLIGRLTTCDGVCIPVPSPRANKGEQCMHVSKAQQCIGCGKKLSGVGAKCPKCSNSSFEHLQQQLRDSEGSIVSNPPKDNIGSCEEPSAEWVPLKQFINGGKRNMYLNYGVLVLDQECPDNTLRLSDVQAALSNDQQLVAQAVGGVAACLQHFNEAQVKGLDSKRLVCPSCKQLHSDVMKSVQAHKVYKCQSCGNKIGLSKAVVSNPLSDVFHEFLQVKELNFTHRTAHGGDGDQDVEHGQYDALATKTLEDLKLKYPSVFETPTFPVDRSMCPQQFHHSIPLKDENAAAPKRKLYPLDQLELVELKKQVQELLETNRIEPSNGPYGAPILFAKKKDGRLRMCIDYRMLNAQTRADVFPLPRIDELLQRLDGAQVFSKLDLRDGYHQVPMTTQDKVKTAFTCRYGTYQFTVMPFGLMTAPATFQRMMNHAFFELLDKGVVCYLDDLLIYSKDVQSHKKLLDEVFRILRDNKLYLKDSKCHLFLESVNFLGHVVTKHGVSVEGGKVNAVKDWPVPTNLNQVQQFLGLCNYYRKFVLRFSELAGPLTQLTRKGQEFVWGDQQQKAFDALKASLCAAPTLRIFDSSLPTRVVCDASNVCVGAVIEQQDAKSGAWHPIEFFSKRLSNSERNYSATDREFVAIRLALERWRHFLIGHPFVLLTDHAALTYLQTSASVNRRNARWLDFLSQFSFTIEHIKGKENVVADTLSRIPGSESLSALELCSDLCTLNVLHFVDEPGKGAMYDPLQLCGLSLLHGIISINEKESFRDQLLAEQCSSDNAWFADLVAQATKGSATYQYRNGLLCKLVDDHFCPIVPCKDSSTIRVILSDLHASALGGHVGRKKLLDLAKKRFFWQNMYASISDFCKSCVVCQQNKGSTQRPAGLLQPLENPTRCFDHISMDFVTSLPQSNGFDGVFTIVDRFSRLVKFIPCASSLTAADAAQLLFDRWICHHGVPSKIISDRDPKFTSQFWSSLCAALSCRLALSSAYHPQSDGLTERYHRSLEQILRCYCSTQQDKWTSVLSQCEFALNSTVVSSHGYSPFQVVFGFVPTLPIDTSIEIKSHSVQQLMEQRADVHHQVSELLRRSAATMKLQADKGRRPSTLSVGSQVWLSTAHLPLKDGARKLAERWTGPFAVVAQVTTEAWKLALPEEWRIHPVFHSSQLKPLKGPARAPQPIQLEDGQAAEEEYEVAAVLAKRRVRNKTQYLVRWKGFSAWHDTWEPAANLRNAQEAVRKFESTAG